MISDNVDVLQNEGAARWGEKETERNPHCYKWIIYKCAVHGDISRDDRLHTSANCGRWEFNSKVMSVLALNIICNPSINISFHKVLCFFGLVLGLIIFIKRASTVHRHIHEWKCTRVVCASTAGTGAPLFKVSPWALKLWQRTRRDFSPSLQHPSQLQNITRTSLGRSRGETWSGREGRIHHNNSCFQITTTWGRGVGYILWVERDHGCSFIYLHSQH